MQIQAEKKFKDISTAYQVLNDPQKRKEYDEYGDNDRRASGSHPHTNRARWPPSRFPYSSYANTGGGGDKGAQFSFNVDDFGESDFFGNIFQNMFGGPMESQKGTRYQTQQTQMPPSPAVIEKIIQCTLEDIFHGCRKTFRLKDVVLGQILEREIAVDIKPGWKSGTKVTFAATSSFPIRVVFTIQIKPHAYFERIGHDLKWICKVTQTQLNRGVVIRIPMIDGSELRQNTNTDFNNNPIRNGTTKIFHGLGMPIPSSTSTSPIVSDAARRGNFILIFEVTTP